MRKPYYIPYIILLLIITACGSYQNVLSDTGSISFNLELSRPTTMLRAAAATSANVCTDYGIVFINAKVINSSGSEVSSGNWSCSVHQGTIEGVPSGADYTVRITGTLTGGTIAWRGEVSGVGVTAGEITPAGIIIMVYTGNDIVPPEIISITPSDQGAGIPVTSIITAKFSETMAASFINDSTFTLTMKNGATPVSGSVSYDVPTRSAGFVPAANLSYSTEYSATLTTDIEDMAGNKIESVYSWNFTTEDPPAGPPDVPAGLIAASGNSQITLSWDAVPAATSYNIYWSETSGVLKTTDTPIPDITTNSYTHTGLTNGKIYYYVVTSENNDGESNDSYEISSAPGSIDGALPTGAISINNEADSTESTEVTLSLSSSSTRGISQMCISNTTTCSSWEPYTTSKLWPLTTGDGFKFVYVWFKDSTGASNAEPYFDTINLDTPPP